MSTVRMLAGLLMMVIFVTSVLLLASPQFPEVGPTGVDLETLRITGPTVSESIQPFALDQCGSPGGNPPGTAGGGGGGGGGGSGIIPPSFSVSPPGTLAFHEGFLEWFGFFGCISGNFFRMIGNFFAQLFDSIGRVVAFTQALILFRIPALAGSGEPLLQLIGLLVAVPIWFTIAYFGFATVRSLIPFIRGS